MALFQPIPDVLHQTDLEHPSDVDSVGGGDVVRVIRLREVLLFLLADLRETRSQMHASGDEERAMLVTDVLRDIRRAFKPLVAGKKDNKEEQS